MSFSLRENGTRGENTFFFSPFLTFFPHYDSQIGGSTSSPDPFPYTHTHTSIKNKCSSINSHPQHHPSITIVTMPLEHVITYEAFREITNFIRDNGEDWGEFCHNTSRPSTTRKTMNTLPPSKLKGLAPQECRN